MTGTSARPRAGALVAPLPAILATAVALNAALFLPGVPPEARDMAGRGVVVLAGILAAVAAHDLAHVVAARFLGFRVALAAVGPFVFTPTRRGLRVRVMHAWRELGTGVMIDPRGDRRMNGRWALVALAGPAASLALGVLALDRWPALAAASLARFALAALPWGARSIPADGAQVMLLLAGGAPADRFCALRRIAAAQREGVRPRAWPEHWITDALAIHDGSAAEAMASHYAFRRALDGCAHDRASSFLDRGLALRAQLPRAAACTLLADAAYFEARIRDDAARAKGWLDEAARRRPACPVAERRAAAAVAIASGDFAAGAALAREGLAWLERIQREEQRAMPVESDWLGEMLARAECAVVLPDELLALAG